MKKLTKIYCTLVIIICTLFVGIYAWTTRVDFLDINNVTISSTSGYYESGKGTEDDPFIISRPKHLYNLAWLQDLGFYDDDQYYFELKNDIDMDGLVIPPIGIDGLGISNLNHRFIGNFNGNNYTIRNLKVSVSASELKTYPSVVTNLNEFDFGNYQGLFGYIATEEVEANNVKKGTVSNFYLDGVTITASTNKTCVGLIAGFVDGNLSTVGVAYSSIKVPNVTTAEYKSNISSYTLIGDYNDADTSWGDMPGSGTAFGTTIDINEIRNRMEKIVMNGGTSQLLPEIDGAKSNPPDDGDGLTPASNTALPILVDSSSTYEGTIAKEVTSQYNTGFIVNESKTYKNIDPQTLERVISSKKMYKRVFSNDGTYLDEYITNDDEPYELARKLLITNQEGVYENIASIRLQHQIGVSSNATITISNAVCAGEELDSLLLPSGCIWFKTLQSGTVKLIVATRGNGKNCTFYHIGRSSEQNWSTQSINVIEYTSIENMISDNNFYYLEFPVIAGEEYAIANDSSSNGAYFCYLDLGMSSTSTPTKTIEKIDFVYIKDGGGYSDISEQNSKVCFTVSGTTTSDVELYFRRLESEGVLYFISGSGLTLIPVGSGTNSSASSSSCDSKQEETVT